MPKGAIEEMTNSEVIKLRIFGACETARVPGDAVFAIIGGASPEDYINKILLRVDTDEYGTIHKSQQSIAIEVLMYAVAEPTAGAEWLRKAAFSKPKDTLGLHGDYYGGVIWGGLRFLSWLASADAASCFCFDNRSVLTDREKHQEAQNDCARIIAEMIVNLPPDKNLSFSEKEVGAYAKTLVRGNVYGTDNLIDSLSKELEEKTSISAEARKIVTEIFYGRAPQLFGKNNPSVIAKLLKISLQKTQD